MTPNSTSLTSSGSQSSNTSFSYTGSQSENSSSGGSDNYNWTKSGSYAGGCYNFTSMSADSSGNYSWNYHENGNETQTGVLVQRSLYVRSYTGFCLKSRIFPARVVGASGRA